MESVGTGLRLGLFALVACAAVLVFLAAEQRNLERRPRAASPPPDAAPPAAITETGSGGASGAGDSASPGQSPSADDLVAALAKEPADPKTTRELLELLRQRSETEILEVAAALLARGTPRTVEVAWGLVVGVLDGRHRQIADRDVYAIVGKEATTIFETLDDRTDATLRSVALDGGRRWLAGNLLARIGTLDAIETLLRVLARRDSVALQVIPGATNPASVPFLSRALMSINASETGITAAPLGRTAEGRAELRRILDPTAGYDWLRYGFGKTEAFAALAHQFRDAADLVALDVALRDAVLNDIRNLARHLPDPKEPRYDPYAVPSKSAQARAIVVFLPGHPGSPLEDTLLAMLAGFPNHIVDPLLPKLDASQRERVEAARKASK